MKTYKIKRKNESVSIFENNPHDFLKMNDFVFNDLVESENEFVKNQDLFNFINNDLNLKVKTSSIWTAMNKAGHKKGMVKIEGKATRGYYVKLKSICKK